MQTVRQRAEGSALHDADRTRREAEDALARGVQAVSLHGRAQAQVLLADAEAAQDSSRRSSHPDEVRGLLHSVAPAWSVRVPAAAAVSRLGGWQAASTAGSDWNTPAFERPVLMRVPFDNEVKKTGVRRSMHRVFCLLHG
jgi:hypothetical protein